MQAMSSTPARTTLEADWVEVDGVRVSYGVVGNGPAALFLHGWGLRPWGYHRAIEAMASAGCRVIAPAMPGFGGTKELEPARRTFEGYGDWVSRFLDALEVPTVALVAGHSFGGGVATAFASQHESRVGSLLLVNAVGSPTWAEFPDEVRTMMERPLWDWTRHFSSDVFTTPGFIRVLPQLLGDFIPNLLTNPLGMFRTSEVIRRADLVDHVRYVAGAGVPVSVAWSDRDALVPRSAFDELRHAANVDGVVVEGGHAWLMVDVDGFRELVIGALVDGEVRDASLRP